MNLLRNADFIKSKIIDHVIQRYPGSLIGSEVQFGSNRGFADLIFLLNNLTYIYEIKAASDDFRNLRTQIKIYKGVFDFVNIVVTENHAKVIKNFISDNTGLIIIKSTGDLETIREAKLIRNNRKGELISSMTVKFLIDYYSLKVGTNSTKIRSILAKNKLDNLKRGYYSFLEKKLLPKNEIFFSEFGSETHLEDVNLLSFNENTELLQ